MPISVALPSALRDSLRHPIQPRKLAALLSVNFETLYTNPLPQAALACNWKIALCRECSMIASRRPVLPRLGAQSHTSISLLEFSPSLSAFACTARLWDAWSRDYTWSYHILYIVYYCILYSTILIIVSWSLIRLLSSTRSIKCMEWSLIRLPDLQILSVLVLITHSSSAINRASKPKSRPGVKAAAFLIHLHSSLENFHISLPLNATPRWDTGYVLGRIYQTSPLDVLRPSKERPAWFSQDDSPCLGGNWVCVCLEFVHSA